MRRLFSTFPDGLPGAGLLVMRLVTGTAVLVRCVFGMWEAGIHPAVLPLLLPAIAALFLLAGLWTSLAGASVASVVFWRLFFELGDPWFHILLATLGVALALLGPGAWSADAYLFGWERIEIRARRNDPNAR